MNHPNLVRLVYKQTEDKRDEFTFDIFFRNSSIHLRQPFTSNQDGWAWMNSVIYFNRLWLWNWMDIHHFMLFVFACIVNFYPL